MTAEQEARGMLERMGVAYTQNMTAGDLVELANLIAENRYLKDKMFPPLISETWERDKDGWRRIK